MKTSIGFRIPKIWRILRRDKKPLTYLLEGGRGSAVLFIEPVCRFPTEFSPLTFSSIGSSLETK